MVKPQRQRSSSSSPPAPPSEITHHFFKVYMPSFCLYSLKIPMTFMMKLNGVMSENVILKDPLKRLWRVEVTKVKDVFYFQNGWEEFVKGNGLNMGEFLVFHYAGNSAFYVDIFDNSECEKNMGLKDDSRKKLNKTSTPYVNEEEVESESESESDDQTSSYSDYLPSEGEDCEEEIYKSKLSASSNSDLPSEGEDCEEEIYKSKPSASSNSDLPSEGEDCEEEIYKSKPSVVSNGESKLPRFIVSLRESNMHSLHIPINFVRRDDIDIKSQMVLRDPRQRSLPVNICSYNDRTIIGKGWNAFWMRNNLQPGDQCMFVFQKCKVKGRDENSNEINVKVIRTTGKRPSAPHKT